MTIIHHPALRVNADVPEPHVEILAESGWLLGHHPDSDFPDYPMTVLPEPAPEPELAPAPVKPPKPPKE